MREIKIIDTTLRDAHQCLWATRMTTAMMLAVADKMDRIGFESLDLLGGSGFDVCVRYLKENPWERISLMREKTPRTKLQGGMRSKGLISFDQLPDDINFLWLECLAKRGIRRVRTLDALCDYDNQGDNLRKVKELGMEAVGSVVYSLSPVHTDEFYAAKTKELVERANIDVMKLKDQGGLLTPDRIRTLVPAMLKVLPANVPLSLHSHCITGLAPLVYIEGVKLGVSQLETSIAPLANGQAQPATQTIVRNLRSIGYTLNVDDELIEQVSQHFARVAHNEGLPVGVPQAYDEFHYQHQIPGGMLANFKFQLEQAGLSHKLPEVLEECALIREDLGWPVMVTPFSQFVGIQAVLNVVQGERYKTVPDEVKKYALGYYGKLIAPVKPNIMELIVSRASPQIALTPPPREPAVSALRKKYPNMSDEERLLRYCYIGAQVDDMLAAGAMRTEYYFDKPIVRLLKELAKRRKPARIYIEKGATRIELGPAR